MSISNLNIIPCFNQLNTDYKAEVVAATLIDLGYKAEDIFISRDGLNNRPRNKDIAHCKLRYFDLDQGKLIIETNRNGLYDYLPEGVFHKPSLGGLNRSTETIIESIRYQRKVEADSRSFFIPFELETSYIEIAALHFQTCLYGVGLNNDLLEVLEGLWPILSTLEPDHAKIFIHMLPFFYAARGNKIWFGRCLSAFLNSSVTITNIHNQVAALEDEADDNLLLGNSRLGIDLLLSGAHFDGNMNWNVNIGPIAYSDIPKFINGSPYNDLLAVIYEYCVPVSVTALQYVITGKTSESFMLSEAQQSETYLGFSTFL